MLCTGQAGLAALSMLFKFLFVGLAVFLYWASGLGSIDYAFKSLGLGSVMHWSGGLGSIEFAVQVLGLGSVDYASQVLKAWQCYALIKRAWQH